LIHLFEEIDVNGDETMEWNEFSNHIIELGMIKKDQKGSSSDVIKNYYQNNNIKNLDNQLSRDAEIERLYFIDT